MESANGQSRSSMLTDQLAGQTLEKDPPPSYDSAVYQTPNAPDPIKFEPSAPPADEVLQDRVYIFVESGEPARVSTEVHRRTNSATPGCDIKCCRGLCCHLIYFVVACLLVAGIVGFVGCLVFLVIFVDRAV